MWVSAPVAFSVGGSSRARLVPRTSNFECGSRFEVGGSTIDFPQLISGVRFTLNISFVSDVVEPTFVVRRVAKTRENDRGTERGKGLSAVGWPADFTGYGTLLRLVYAMRVQSRFERMSKCERQAAQMELPDWGN
jgi:hypothetical protein